MFKRLKQRLEASGPGVIVAVIAMVLALTGGAFAAAGKLTGPQKKEVEKIAKKFAGKPGKPGAAGATGPAGKDGANGKDGTNGTNGTNGKSAVVNSEPKGLNCKEGGVSVEVSGEPATKKFACNGLEGKEGSPWTDGGTLPPGATETGVWTFTGNEADKKGIHIPLSFPIQLAEKLEAGRVHWPKDADFETYCPGGFGAPTADPGHLCVYRSGSESLEGTKLQGIFSLDRTLEPEERGASKVGALLFLEPPTSNEASGSGSFAVTGCGNAEFPCPTP